MSEAETANTTAKDDPNIVYEWVVERDSNSGISDTEEGARVALSETLLSIGQGSGFVRPVSLAHDGEDWAYLRFPINYRAIGLRQPHYWFDQLPRRIREEEPHATEGNPDGETTQICGDNKCAEAAELANMFGHDQMGHRIVNALVRERLTTSGKIRALTTPELMDIRDIGPTAAARIRLAFPYGTNNSAN